MKSMHFIYEKDKACTSIFRSSCSRTGSSSFCDVRAMSHFPVYIFLPPPSIRHVLCLYLFFVIFAQCTTPASKSFRVQRSPICSRLVYFFLEQGLQKEHSCIFRFAPSALSNSTPAFFLVFTHHIVGLESD
jgi:hypothetical protein